MNDKQQLAAMGAQYRLTEEQAKGLAERMPQTGALQVIDDEPLCTEIRINGVEACGADIGGLLDRCLPHTTEQKPLCMAKRIEELEAQARGLVGLLRDLHKHIGTSIPQTVSEHYRGCDLLDRIDAALAGKLPDPAMPEGWQLVPVEPTCYQVLVGRNADSIDDEPCVAVYLAMLSAAPSPDGAK